MTSLSSTASTQRCEVLSFLFSLVRFRTNFSCGPGIRLILRHFRASALVLDKVFSSVSSDSFLMILYSVLIYLIFTCRLNVWRLHWDGRPTPILSFLLSLDFEKFLPLWFRRVSTVQIWGWQNKLNNKQRSISIYAAIYCQWISTYQNNLIQVEQCRKYYIDLSIQYYWYGTSTDNCSRWLLISSIFTFRSNVLERKNFHRWSNDAVLDIFQ